MKKIQDAIKARLNNKGVTYEELAARCGWSEARLSAFLNGYHKLNSADYGVICEALGVTFSTFYHRTKGIARQ